MNVDPETLVAGLGFLGTLVGFLWRERRILDAKLESQRQDYDLKLARLRADHDEELRDLAEKVAACVRREEMKSISDNIARVHERVDDIWKFMVDKLSIPSAAISKGT